MPTTLPDSVSVCYWINGLLSNINMVVHAPSSVTSAHKQHAQNLSMQVQMLIV